MAAPTLTTRTPSVHAALPLVGAVATLGLTSIVATRGFALPVQALFGLGVFALVVAGFVAVPWWMVAATIPLYALLPTLKVFVSPTIGAVKDLVALAAVTAAVLVVLRRRAARVPTGLDGPTVALLGLLLLLYLANVGGLLTGQTGHGNAWFQGVRLFFEPLALLVVGMVLRDPRRTQWAGTQALLASAVVAAVWGIGQQSLGVSRLLSLGYRYGEEVRQIGGRLRSFGTLGEPFTFASFLLLAIAVVIFARRPRGMYAIALAVLALGLFFSYVRTAALIAVALLGLALARSGRTLAAALLVAVAVAAAGVIFVVASEARATRAVPVNPTTYITLNGRAQVWREQLGKPGDWLFGRGVGAVGTAAQRARESLSGKQQIGTSAASGTVVDSGYLALVADVGLAGLLILVALFVHLARLAYRSSAAEPRSAWLAMGLLLAMVIDGLSRESFTAFPTAYVGMLLVGLSISAARAPRRT